MGPGGPHGAIRGPMRVIPSNVPLSGTSNRYLEGQTFSHVTGTSPRSILNPGHHVALSGAIFGGNPLEPCDIRRGDPKRSAVIEIERIGRDKPPDSRPPPAPTWRRSWAAITSQRRQLPVLRPSSRDVDESQSALHIGVDELADRRCNENRELQDRRLVHQCAALPSARVQLNGHAQTIC